MKLKVFHLYCLACKATYSIPVLACRLLTYREYSYCDKCHIKVTGKPRRIVAKLFTRRGRNRER